MDKNRDCRYSRLSDDDRTALSVIAALIKESVEFFDEISLNPSYGKPISNALIKLCTLLEETQDHLQKTIPYLLSSGTKEVPDDEKYIVVTAHGNVEWTDDGFICPRCRSSNGFDYISQNPYCRKCGLKMEPNWGDEQDEA